MSALLLGVQVAAQEIAKGPVPDRMSAIASHIIGQRRCGPSPHLSAPASSAITECIHLEDKSPACLFISRHNHIHMTERHLSSSHA